MKLHHKKTNIVRDNVGTETAFQIKTTAKAFDILSSGLYTDNIRAVVRELSCNAYDAHVAAGNESEPFEIHIPNALEPWFHVKDFGIGLSEDDIMGLYTTYFESTKSNSNDFIGALGLGSKSPFSYATSFTVTSIFDGMRKIYTVFINEHGVPTIAKMGEKSTDDHNGIQVTLTVKPDDFGTFAARASSVLRWFSVPPVITGDPAFDFTPLPAHNISGANWHLLPRTYNDPTMTAVQGNVAYVVNLEHFDTPMATLRLIQTGHLVMFFDIGDLEVAASREEIKYDKLSVKKIQQEISTMCDEIIHIIENATVDHSANQWEFNVFMDDKYRGMFGSTSTIRTFLKSNIASIQHPQLLHYTKNQHFAIPQDIVGWQIYEYNSPRYSSSTSLVRKSCIDVYPSKNTHVFLQDVTVNGISRLGLYKKANNLSTILLISKIKEATKPIYTENELGVNIISGRALISESEYVYNYTKLINSLGDVEVLSVDKETPPAEKKTRITRFPIFKIGEVTTSLRYYSRDVTQQWDRVSSSFEYGDNTGLYFTLRNGRNICTRENNEVSWNDDDIRSNFKKMLAIVNDLGFNFTMDDIIGVNPAYAKKLAKLPKQWYNIFDLVSSAMPKYTNMVQHRQNILSTPDSLGLVELLDSDVFVGHVDALDNNSQFRKEIVNAKQKHSIGIGEESMVKFLSEFDQRYGKNVFGAIMGTALYAENELVRTYPMLSLTGDMTDNKESLNHFFDYINLIDRSK